MALPELASGNRSAGSIPEKDTCNHPLPGVFQLQEAAGSTESIMVRWYLSTSDHMEKIKVMRKEAGETKFTACEAMPGWYKSNDSLFVILRDTAIQPIQWYSYYLIPYDFCGNAGTPSDTVTLASIASHELPIARNIVTEGVPAQRAIDLTWTADPRIAVTQTHIYRANTPEGPYTRIATTSPTLKNYRDFVPEANENYYYYLIIDTPFGTGDQSAIVFNHFTGSDIPNPPTGLKASYHEKGIRLSWNKGERFVIGYYLYRKSYNDTIVRNISGFIPANRTTLTFIDTNALVPLRTYFYQVVAISDGFNESHPSTTAEIRAQEKEVPAPENLRVIHNVDLYMIFWDDFSYVYPWIDQCMLLFRFNNGQTDTAFIQMPQNSLFYTTDRQINTIGACFISTYGNTSPITYSETGVTPDEVMTPEGISALRTEEGILISWPKAYGSRIASYCIYRETENETPQRIGTTPGSGSSYLDSTAQSGTRYGYAVAAINTRGEESEKSEIVIIRK